MRDADPQLLSIQIAAGQGAVSDELWRMGCHAAKVAATLIPLGSRPPHDVAGASALRSRAARLTLLALCAPDILTLRDRVLGDELHRLLDERRGVVAARVVRQLRSLRSGHGAGRGSRHDAGVPVLHAFAQRDLETIDGWPVVGTGALPAAEVSRVSEAVSQRGAGSSFEVAARTVMERLLVNVATPVADLVNACVAEVQALDDRSLSEALALLAPAEARTQEATLRPWAAMLAGSAAAAATAAGAAVELSVGHARRELLNRLFSSVDAGHVPPVPRLQMTLDAAGPTAPQPGDLWLTAARPAASIVMVLPFAPASDTAVLVAPVDLHWHAAGATDIVLRAEDSSLDIALRAVLGLETLVEIADLDRRLGGVDQAVVRQLADALLIEARYGSSPAAEEDPWMALDAPLSSALSSLTASPTASAPGHWVGLDDPVDPAGSHPMAALWAELADVWTAAEIPDLLRLFGALPPGPLDNVFALRAVIAKNGLHQAARDIAFGRGAVAASGAEHTSTPFWPVTAESYPGLDAHVIDLGGRSKLVVEGLPPQLERTDVVLVVAEGFTRGTGWWLGLEGVLGPDAAVSGGRVEVSLGAADLRSRDLDGLAVVPAPPGANALPSR